jgi:hypothetical protein
MIKRPEKFGITDVTKLMTPVSNFPIGVGRGRKRSSVSTQMYAHLLENMNQPFHINIPFANRKEANNFAANLYNRARQDGLCLSRCIVQDETKANSWNLWLELSR